MILLLTFNKGTQWPGHGLVWFVISKISIFSIVVDTDRQRSELICLIIAKEVINFTGTGSA